MKIHPASFRGLIPLVLLGIVSCATLPPERPSQEWLGILPPESTCFMALNVDTVPEILEGLLTESGFESQEIEGLLEKTRRLYAGVTLSPLAPTALSAIALGRYPVKLVRLSLDLSESWQRSGASRTYWQSRRGLLQVAIPERNIILASTEAVERMLTRFSYSALIPLPREVELEMERGDFILFFPTLPFLSDEGRLKELPIRRMWVSARKEEPWYELLGVFSLGDYYEIRQARAVEALLKLILISWMRQANLGDMVSRLRDMQIMITGDRVQIVGLRLSSRELIGILRMLFIEGAVARG